MRESRDAAALAEARTCHDHLAAMTARLLGLGWVERGSRRRAVRVTPAGREGPAATFGWSLEG
jgi:hypothetical protein